MLHIHGKYTHLLQFLMLALAKKNGLIKLKDTWTEILSHFLENNAESWMDILDGTYTHKPLGPRPFQSLVLSDIVKEIAPSFHKACLISFLKKIQHYCQNESFFNSESAIKFLITEDAKNAEYNINWYRKVNRAPEHPLIFTK